MLSIIIAIISLSNIAEVGAQRDEAILQYEQVYEELTSVKVERARAKDRNEILTNQLETIREKNDSLQIELEATNSELESVKEENAQLVEQIKALEASEAASTNSQDNSSTTASSSTSEDITSSTNMAGNSVYIPRTGLKYHSNSTCSGMNNPSLVTLEYAQSHNYTPCKKCYG